MNNSEHSEEELSCARRKPDTEHQTERKPVVFAATMSAIFFALWFFLFGHIRPATEPRVETSSKVVEVKVEPVSMRPDQIRESGEKLRPERNAEEKALLLFLLRAFEQGAR